MIYSLAEKAAIKLLGHGWTHRRQLMLSIRCNLPPRSSAVRFAFSALLKFECRDSVVLIRNAHRPESFSAIGGVIKYKVESREALDGLDVQFQTAPAPDDMLNDLRGFLPRKHLPLLTKWYISEKGREVAKECIRRELIEELGEVNIKLAVPDPFHVRHVRTVVENLRLIPEEGYQQHRIFEIFEPSIDHRDINEFCDKIASHVGQRKDLILATREEIFSGRSKRGELIAPIVRYLYSSRPIFAHIPMLKK